MKEDIWCNQKSIAVLKKNRKSIWNAAKTSMACMIFCYLLAGYFWYISFLFTALLFEVFMLLFFICFAGLVLKRDLFSVLIYLKEHEKDEGV